MAFEWFNQLSEADRQKFLLSVSGRFAQNAYNRPGQGMRGFGNAMIGSMGDYASIRDQSKRAATAKRAEERSAFLMEEAERKRDKEIAFEEKIANIFKDYGVGEQPEKEPPLIRDYSRPFEPSRPSPLLPERDIPSPLTGKIGQMPSGAMSEIKMAALETANPSQVLSMIDREQRQNAMDTRFQTRQDAIDRRRNTQKPVKPLSLDWFVKKDSEGSLTETEANMFKTKYQDQYFRSNHFQRKNQAAKQSKLDQSSESDGNWFTQGAGNLWDQYGIGGSVYKDEVPYGSLK